MFREKRPLICATRSMPAPPGFGSDDRVVSRRPDPRPLNSPGGTNPRARTVYPMMTGTRYLPASAPRHLVVQIRVFPNQDCRAFVSLVSMLQLRAAARSQVAAPSHRRGPDGRARIAPRFRREHSLADDRRMRAPRRERRWRRSIRNAHRRSLRAHSRSLIVAREARLPLNRHRIT
jgi:hypothetical protein